MWDLLSLPTEKTWATSVPKDWTPRKSADSALSMWRRVQVLPASGERRITPLLPVAQRILPSEEAERPRRLESSPEWRVCWLEFCGRAARSERTNKEIIGARIDGF